MNSTLKYIALIPVLFISACTAVPVAYTPTAETDLLKAVNIIEQVLYEQPDKYRPESVFISNQFIAISNGKRSTHRGVSLTTLSDQKIVGLGSIKTLTKDFHTKYSFKVMHTMQLYKKKDKYVAHIRTLEGRALLKVSVDSEYKAKRFLDAIMFFTGRDMQNGDH